MILERVIKLMTDYESAIITAVDGNGYPVSVRCRPRPDYIAKALKCDISNDLGIQNSPASLLCHSHDEWIFNMTSFGVRGSLEHVEDGWLFYPRRIVPGAGLSPSDLISLLRNGRKNAKK